MSLLEKKVQTIWLITFGDLLTLLLCFFVAVITLSRARASSFNDAIRKQSSDAAVLAEMKPDFSAAVTRSDTGTLVALRDSEESLETVEIARGRNILVEISITEGQLGEGLLKKLEAVEGVVRPYIDRRFLRAAGADIEVCKRADSGDEEAAAQTAAERVLLLNRQLIDLGFPATGLRLRTVGSRCSALGPGLGSKGGGDAAVRVTLTLEK